MRKFLAALFILFALLVNISFAGVKYDYNDAQESLKYLSQFIKVSPDIAIITGSGLGSVADVIENKIIIDTQNIPNWPQSTAPGHEGKIILGQISGKNIILLQGRLHYYEGHSMKAVIFPTRVLKLMGVKNLIITNAAGAINKNFKVGDIIAIRDHINFLPNPLIGRNDERFNVRFPDMTELYNKKFLAFLESLGLKTGVYVATTGASLETPAEINMFRILGADVVGMSSVPGAITAHAMGIKVCMLSCVSNMAAGIEGDKNLSANDFIFHMRKNAKKLSEIIVKLIESL